MGADDRHVRTPESHPSQRNSDKGWRRFVRDNWYRDVWLLVVSAVVLVAIIKALGAANDAKDNVAAIQDSRVALTRDTCEQQNSRHDNTIKRLNKLVNEIHDPRQRRRAQANIAGTISLIDALAPHQNCTALIHSRFPGVK